MEKDAFVVFGSHNSVCAMAMLHDGVLERACWCAPAWRTKVTKGLALRQCCWLDWTSMALVGFQFDPLFPRNHGSSNAEEGDGSQWETHEMRKQADWQQGTVDGVRCWANTWRTIGVQNIKQPNCMIFPSVCTGRAIKEYDPTHDHKLGFVCLVIFHGFYHTANHHQTTIWMNVFYTCMFYLFQESYVNPKNNACLKTATFNLWPKQSKVSGSYIEKKTRLHDGV